MRECEHNAHKRSWRISIRSLEEEPRTVPSARTWPLRINTSPYERTRQPEGWVREFSHTPNSFSVTTRHSAGGLGRRRTPVRTTYQPPSDARPCQWGGLRDKHQSSTTATTIRYTSATQGIFQYNNVLGSVRLCSPSQGITTTYKRRFARRGPQRSSTHRQIGAIRTYAGISTTSTWNLQDWEGFKRIMPSQPRIKCN